MSLPITKALSKAASRTRALHFTLQELVKFHNLASRPQPIAAQERHLMDAADTYT